MLRVLAAYKAAPSIALKMQGPMHMGGRLLETIPEHLGIDDPQSRTCCGALSCFGCVYLIDIYCTIPTMRKIEAGDDAYDMRLLPFYEACWPCMLCAHYRETPTMVLRGVSSLAKCPWDCYGIFDRAFR